MKKIIFTLFLVFTATNTFADTANPQNQPLYRYGCNTKSSDTIFELNIQNDHEVFYTAGNTNVGYFGANGYAARAEDQSKAPSGEVLFSGEPNSGAISIFVSESMLDGKANGTIRVPGFGDFDCSLR